MRKLGIEKRPKVVIQNVICDECGAECKNTNIAILFKFSFSDTTEHFKDVCWKCFDEKYKDEWHKNKEKQQMQ